MYDETKKVLKIFQNTCGVHIVLKPPYVHGDKPFLVSQASELRDQALDILCALTHWDLLSSKQTPIYSKWNLRVSGLIHTVSKSSILSHSHDSRPNSSTQRKGTDSQMNQTSQATKNNYHENTPSISSLYKPHEIQEI